MAKKAVVKKPGAKKSGKRAAKKVTPRERKTSLVARKALNPKNPNIVVPIPVAPVAPVLSAEETNAKLDEATSNSETLDCFVNAPDRSHITNPE